MFLKEKICQFHIIETKQFPIPQKAETFPHKAESLVSSSACALSTSSENTATALSQGGEGCNKVDPAGKEDHGQQGGLYV